MTAVTVNHCPDCDAPYSAAVTVQQSIDLVKWVAGLDDEARLRLLVYLCGYRPELMEMLRLEQGGTRHERVRG